MQRLNRRVQAVFRRGPAAPPPDDATRRRMDLRWGIIGLVVIVVAAGAVGIVSRVQFGVSDYSAHLTDAAALRIGDEVRVAGITVGKVKSLDLQSDRVEMTFSVDDGVFVGDQSTLDIRMLTIVGGHYVALLPGGKTPLGRNVIPADRVLLPYSLPKVFQDAVTPFEQIDGETLRRNFGALATAVDGTPDGFRRMTTAVGSIVDILDQQNAQVSRTLTIADEYVSAIAENKAVVGRAVDRLRLLATIVEDNKLAVGASLRNLASVLSQIAPVARLWTSDLKPLAQPIADALPQLEELGQRLGALLDSIRGFGERLQSLITPEGVVVDQSAATITAPALCIPTPGRSC